MVPILRTPALHPPSSATSVREGVKSMACIIKINNKILDTSCAPGSHDKSTHEPPSAAQDSLHLAICVSHTGTTLAVSAAISPARGADSIKHHAPQPPQVSARAAGGSKPTACAGDIIVPVSPVATCFRHFTSIASRTHTTRLLGYLIFT